MARSSVFASPGDFSNGANTPYYLRLICDQYRGNGGIDKVWSYHSIIEKSLSIGALGFPFEGQRLFVCKWFT